MSSESPSTNGPPRTAAGQLVKIADPQTINPQLQVCERENELLRVNLGATQIGLQRVQADLYNALARNARDTEIINTLHARLAELKDLIHKQKQTISNQSKTISNRRFSKRKSTVPLPPMTPHRQDSSMMLSPSETPVTAGSQGSSVYERPPPMFDIGYNSLFANQATLANVATAPSQLLGLDQLALPQPFSNALARANSPGQFEDVDISENMNDFAEKLKALWKKTENYGQIHGNVPNMYKESRMNQKAKQYIIAVSDTSGASFLLGSPATRFLLVAKAINRYLVDEVLKTTIVKGFDPAVDEEIGQVRSQLFPDTPPMIRHLIHLAVVTQVNRVVVRHGFPAFSRQKLQELTQKLWGFIGPLTNNDLVIQPNQAWEELVKLVAEAQTIAIDMLRVPLEFRYEFPETNEPFDPSTMSNRDVSIKGDHQAPKNNDSRVRLGITPMVRIRSNSEAASVIKLTCLADVLLRPVSGRK